MVLLGAVPGALLRWQSNSDLLVNVFGAALLGFLVGKTSLARAKLLLGVGFCGALTTFSGWIFKSVQLIATGSFLEALSLIMSTLFLGLLFATLGLLLSQKF